MNPTRTIAVFGVASLAFLLTTIPARAEIDIPIDMSLPVQTQIQVTSTATSNGPVITLSGQMSLGEYKADLRFQNNKKGTKTYMVTQGVTSMVLLDATQPITIPVQPFNLSINGQNGAGGNPHMFVQFFRTKPGTGVPGNPTPEIDDTKPPLTDETYLGRVKDAYLQSPDMFLSFFADLHGKHRVATSGCNNKGSSITLDSTLSFTTGVMAKFRFQNRITGNMDPNPNTPPQFQSGVPGLFVNQPDPAPVNVSVIVSGLDVSPIRKSTPGVTGNPLIAIQFDIPDPTGFVILGRCNAIGGSTTAATTTTATTTGTYSSRIQQ